MADVVRVAQAQRALETLAPEASCRLALLADDHAIDYVLGIDTSDPRATRNGIRGANGLVWVGKAADHAAKLTELSAQTPTWITPAVYQSMNESLRIGNDKLDMGRRRWQQNVADAVYGSTCWWEFT